MKRVLRRHNRQEERKKTHVIGKGASGNAADIDYDDDLCCHIGLDWTVN